MRAGVKRARAAAAAAAADAAAATTTTAGAAAAATLAPGWQRYRVAFQYIGTPYSGWQRNPLAPRLAVQDVVERAVEALVGAGNCSPCQVSSRTDAGVHALANVLHVDLCRRPRQDLAAEPLEPHPPEVVRTALNARLRHKQVRVLGVTTVDAANFHARFSARERRYVYRIVTGKSVFEAERAWCVGHPLDVAAMQRAAQALVGRHDFSSFRGRDCQAKSPVKTVRGVSVHCAPPELPHPPGYGDLVQVHVRAESFLYHMVRNMVGALQAIGSGRLPPEAMQSILEARDRRAAPEMAPAHGLYLQSVLYDEDLAREKAEGQEARSAIE